MRIISRRRLREFWTEHPQAEIPLKAWYTRVKVAKWTRFADMQFDFPDADQVKRLTVFNVGGNKYRLVVRIEYELEQVYIRAIMTHGEYDKDKWKDDDWFE